MQKIIADFTYFLPFFTEQTIAIKRMQDGTYQTLCNVFALDDAQEKFDGIIKMRFVSFMGKAYFVKQISNVVYCTGTKRP